MNFTVYWRPRAEAQLRAIWRTESNREAVADAADAVNRLLQTSAHELGESRERGTRRIWFQQPLCVVYEIDAVAKVVYVSAAKWVGH
jgi:plasmid stabilization system protein ParE